MRLRIAVAAALAFSVSFLAAQPLSIGTLAGSTTGGGHADAIGANARFSAPRAIAMDTLGNFYVADTGNHAIRKITPAGEVSTLAFDGVGSMASFRYPEGIAIDAARNLYIADWGNNVIRRITQAGVVTTVAGSANDSGSTDGTGGNARFLGPEDVASDANGNLYVTDQNHLIRHVTNTGVVTTVAGLAGSPGNVNGIGSAARFTWPEGIVLTPSGRLLIVDTYNHAIRVGREPMPKRRAARR